MKVGLNDDLPAGFQVIDTLGHGGEGAVYVVSESASARHYVMKIFHEPLPRTWAVGLRIYARQVSADELGLPSIKLWGTADKICGVYYPFIRLRRIHWRLVSSCEQIARSMVGSCCRMQHYLMSQHGIGMLEPLPQHLMVSGDGRFFYVDFGYGISTLDHSETRRLNLFGFGFAAFLASLYGRNLRTVEQPFAGHSFEEPCTYFAAGMLDEVAAEHRWIAPIVGQVRSSPAAILLDAEFYRRLGSQLPDRLGCPRLIVGASDLLCKLGGLRGTNRMALAR